VANGSIDVLLALWDEEKRRLLSFREAREDLSPSSRERNRARIDKRPRRARSSSLSVVPCSPSRKRCASQVLNADRSQGPKRVHNTDEIKSEMESNAFFDLKRPSSANIDPLAPEFEDWPSCREDSTSSGAKDLAVERIVRLFVKISKTIR
jgi:hypothetical protein